MKRIILALSILAVTAGVASAQGTVIRRLDFKAAPPIDPKNPPPKDAPKVTDKIMARVKSDIPNLKAPDFKIVYAEGEQPVESVATAAQAFKDSNEELAIVILVQGSERFMGNMSTVDDEGQAREPTEGAYDQIKPAVEALLKVGPKKTKGAILVYGKDVLIKQPMGPLAALNGETIGGPKEFHGVGEKQFKNGLEKAFELLTTESNARKVLVVIGDGGDTNAQVNISDTAKKFEGAGIDVYAIRATPKREDFENNNNKNRMKQLGSLGLLKEATKVGDIPDLAQQIALDIDSLYVLEFPTDNFQYDGQEHEYSVFAKKSESKSMGLTLPKTEGPKEAVVEEKKGGSKWWLWLLIIGGVLGLGVVALLIFGKKPEQMPIQQMAPMPPPPPGPMGPAPSAGGAQKTMMLGVGGKEDGLPVVGWIVPLSGPAQYQTFKLQGGKTLVGTSADCNIVVPDAFMSTHHCEIVMTPSGFSLIDKGSTNGCIVNTKRVPTHELVDNDVITLGKTDFKFKSIL
jgi:hypothetical protein